MKKEDEKLVCALMLGDEKGACQALDEGGNPEIIIQTCHSVNTIDGIVKTLSMSKVETPLIIGCRMGMDKLVKKLIGMGVDIRSIDNGHAYKDYVIQRPTVVSKHQNIGIATSHWRENG